MGPGHGEPSNTHARAAWLALPVLVVLLGGCSLHSPPQAEWTYPVEALNPDANSEEKPGTQGAGEANATTPPVKERDADKKPQRPKKVLEWAIGKKEEKKENGNGKKENGATHDANGGDKGKDNRAENGKNGGNGAATKDNDEHGKAVATKDEEGAGSKENGNGEAPEEEKRLDPDRPHLPEASTTVGLGRAVLEGGYTYTSKGSFSEHTFPEALLRVGMFAEWFELRIGQSFASEQTRVFNTPGPGALQPPTRGGGSTAGEAAVPPFTTERDTGAQDLYLGCKLALTEQQKYLPEIAIVPQMTVPSGRSPFSAREVLPGLNTDMSWDIVKDRFSVEAVIAVNGAVDDVRHTYVLIDHGVTLVYYPTKNLESFIEWDAFYPAGAIGPQTGPQHYIVGGFVYYFTNNFEMDIRAGVGLNEHANDFLAGPGFAVRY
jgi:hypothetical protein